MKTISLAIQISKVESMADRSMKMVMYTQELAPEEMTKLFNFHQKQAFCVIGESQSMVIDSEDPAQTMVKKVEWKTQSQKLRNVLYIIWKQDNHGLSQEGFYEREMDKIIEEYKRKIL